MKGSLFTSSFKLFVKRVLVFAAPLVIILAVVEVLIRHIPNDYSLKDRWMSKNSRHVKVLILGSSHSFFGIDAKYIPRSFNAANFSQTFKYDWAIIKKYRWDSLETIIIPVDYFTLFYSLKDGPESWLVKNYNMYYGFNNYNPFENFEILGESPRRNFRKLSDYYLRHRSKVWSDELGNGRAPKTVNVDSGIVAVRKHTQRKLSVFRENVAYLDSIVNFRKTIIISTPTYKTYYENLDPEQMSMTYAAIKKQNADYYDFMKDPSFNKEDFFDADHLNESGAKKFTLKLDSILHLR